MRKCCVIGAGNSAHAVAGLVASLPDWESHVYAPRKTRAKEWDKGVSENDGIDVIFPDDVIVKGKPSAISRTPGDVVPGCEMLIFCLPAEAYDENIRSIAQYIDHGAAIGNICAANAWDWWIDTAMKEAGRSPDSYVLFELQNLPWACRVPPDGYGKCVDILGDKPWMALTVRPNKHFDKISKDISRMLMIKQGCPYKPGGFLGFGMSSICQVIHPAVMWGNFKDWDGFTPYQKPPLFYQGMPDESVDKMNNVSNEILSLRHELEKRYPKLDLSVVVHVFPWCLDAYDGYITDKSTLASRFRTNQAYEGLTCPMLPQGPGWVPNYKSRYISEDVPYNLLSIKGVAELAGVSTPHIDELIAWSQKVMQKDYLRDGKVCGADINRSSAPQRFGMTKLEDIPEIRECV